MKRINAKELKIGISVIIAMCILFFGINFLKGVNIFKAANYYYARYDNVMGLAVSSPVMLNGFKVGLVRDIEYDYEHPGNVIVEMSLDRELRLPLGTRAVLSADILGTASIVINLGHEQGFYSVGDSIPGVAEPGLVESLSDRFMPTVAQIFPKIDTLLTNVNALTANPALQASISRLDAITADLQATSANLAEMSRSLAPIPGRITPILSDVNGITTNVGTIAGDVAALSGRLREVPIDSLMANLQQTSENLRILTEQLNDPNSTLGLLTHDAALYDNLNSTVRSLDSLFVDIKRNPKRYVTVKVF